MKGCHSCDVRNIRLGNAGIPVYHLFPWPFPNRPLLLQNSRIFNQNCLACGGREEIPNCGGDGDIS